jgi:mannose-6-phosphate isomerase-like protein (cupin superfamily)
MPYAVCDASDWHERRKPVASTLGARAIRLNRFDNVPGQAGKEHDERESGQEEIYVVVGGSGTIVVDGEEVELRPGRFVLVPPESVRRVVAGGEGLAYVVVGAELS